jgi:hypothetical protein
MPGDTEVTIAYHKLWDYAHALDELARAAAFENEKFRNEVKRERELLLAVVRGARHWQLSVSDPGKDAPDHLEQFEAALAEVDEALNALLAESPYLLD